MNVYNGRIRLFVQSAVIAMVVFVPVLSSAVTLLRETFEGAFPQDNGWSVGDTNGTGGVAYWMDVNSGFGGEGTRDGNWKGYCTGVGYGGTTSNPSYKNSMSAYMRSKKLNLSVYSSATLSFWYKIPSIHAGYDKLRVYVVGLLGNRILIWERSTAQSQWTEVTLSLAAYLRSHNAYVGNDFYIDFEFYSDSSVVAEGAYLDDIVVEGIIGTTLLYEGFEGVFPGGNGWSIGDANGSGGLAYWEDVNSDFGREKTRDGKWKGYCAGMGYGGTATNPTYRNSMSAYMSKAVNLSGYSAAALSFWYKIPSIQAGYDKLRVYVESAFGSALLWERSTAQPPWTEVTLSLNAYAGTTRTIKFVYYSDSSVVAEGAYLDRIRVTAGLPTDAYEPDDTASAATGIIIPQTQSRNIHIVGNKDWVCFRLSSPAPVLLRTGPRTGYTGGDTVMYLYGRNSSTTLITSNDDYNGQWSQITRYLLSGTYFVKVEEYGNNATIKGYTLYLAW